MKKKIKKYLSNLLEDELITKEQYYYFLEAFMNAESQEEIMWIDVDLEDTIQENEFNKYKELMNN